MFLKKVPWLLREPCYIYRLVLKIAIKGVYGFIKGRLGIRGFFISFSVGEIVDVVFLVGLK